MTSGIKIKSAAPANIQNPEINNPRNGILVLDSIFSWFGACLFVAKPNNIRLVENTPLLAEEKADVNTTKLIIAAAAGNPASEKALQRGFYLVKYNNMTLQI